MLDFDTCKVLRIAVTTLSVGSSRRHFSGVYL